MRRICQLVLSACVLFVGSLAFAGAYEDGMKAYRAFQFDKAIQQLGIALKQFKLTKEQKRDIHLHMAVSYYNLAKTNEAEGAYKRALKLDPNAKIPGQQAPQVVQFFAKIRKKAVPPVRRVPPRRVIPRRAIPRRVVPRRVVPRLVVPPRRVVRRVPPPRPAPPKKSFAARHAASITLLALGVVAAGVAVGTGVAYSGANASYEALLTNKAAHEASAIQKSYEPALQMGLATTILLAGAGGLIAAGVIVFFVE